MRSRPRTRLALSTRRWWPAACLLAGAACGAPGSGMATADPAADAFEHPFTGEAVPWTHDRFEREEDEVRFAIVGDLNGGERPGIFRIAIEQLALLRPELILTIGDLIDGASEDSASLHAEWDSFDARAAEAPAPLFRVSGNHDATAAALRRVWIDRYGALHYYFVYRDILFLVLDTDDHTDAFRERIGAARNEAIALLDAGRYAEYERSEYYRMPERQTGQIGPEQAAYFERAIAEHPDVRWTMLFMHKPVWRANDPEFEAIEAALADRPYTVFAGHYHVLSHETRNGRDYIQLATTGGSQTAESDFAFDHVTMVRVADTPSITHLRLDGILDRAGHIPAGGDTVCFQQARCGGSASP